MSYTPERFMADSGITRDEVEAEKRRMLEEIRLYELKEARKAEHVTQKRLAQALGVSQKRISVIESGDVDHIKVDTLKRYQTSLNPSKKVFPIKPIAVRVKTPTPALIVLSVGLCII